MAKKVASTEGERNLLVNTVQGEYRITIPADAKVTFGPAIPSKKEYGNPVLEYALRIYRGGKDNLIAVFTGVREFREFDMPISKKVTSEAGKTLWKSDEGGYEVTTSAKRKSAFVDVKQLTNGEEF